ncbi:MAG: ABC transporter permease [Chloroflexi bacterium]|nr:MAG: ABC transporter permease [Chloroflexota bacterium]
MNLLFVFNELIRHRSRLLASILSIGIGVALFISLQAYSEAYRNAARVPLSEIGSDIIAQKQGERPLAFEGVVFPHSTSPIHAEEIQAIRELPGVIDIGQSIFFWSFDPAGGYLAGLGLDPSETVGPGRLSSAVRAGRFLLPGERGIAVADTNYAAEKHLEIGETLTVSGTTFELVGFVDTTRAGQVANANIYVPLADAQALCSVAVNVLAVHDFRPTDANIIFVRADPSQAPALSEQITGILGMDAIVTTPRSFDRVLGATFALIDRFGLLVGLAGLVVAVVGLLRTTAAGLWERRRDVGVMRAVGWRQKDVVVQLTLETLFLIGLGWLAGMFLASVTTWTFGFTSITVPIPWELAPTPMMLPGGPLKRGVTMPLAAGINPQIALAALGLALLCGGLVGLILAYRTANLKPAEVLRSE